MGAVSTCAVRVQNDDDEKPATTATLNNRHTAHLAGADDAKQAWQLCAEHRAVHVDARRASGSAAKGRHAERACC